MNKRPYRYASTKEDIIENLVQQMLDQGVIQPSYSPFASPVVLSCSYSGAGIRDGCESESRIRRNPNFKIRGCESEYGYGCGDTAKNFNIIKI